MTDPDDAGDTADRDDAPPTGDADLLGHVLLPVANEDDALATARSLEPYGPARVTALHVVEKGEGVPDKTPVEQSETLAEESYAAVRTVFPDADDHTAYGRDVAAEIFAAADAVDATAIVYRSRGGNRIMQLLSGDLSLKLVTNADVPVVALPGTDS
ncbi:universal stress protein [Halorubrum pallidum]